MKVRIDYTIEAPDNYRRSINLYYGKLGLASRTDVKYWCMQFGDSMNDELMYAESMAHRDD